MTPTLTAAPPRTPSHPRRRRARTSSARATQQPLGVYADARGAPREVVLEGAADGTRLLVDRERGTRGDRRLLAHLAADEPAANAWVVCREYLARGHDPLRCRPLRREDIEGAQLPDQLALDAACAPSPGTARELLQGRFSIEHVRGSLSIPELRWCTSGSTPLSLREVVACLQSYEPACSLTAAALLAHRGRVEVSEAVLGAEYRRLRESPIVLNRLLREAVLARVEDGESMSEIAIRCGRLKRDRRGNVSGETSWLARRIGLLAEAGREGPTPWVHSDVLALIARDGLGIAPHEVELA